MTLYGTTDIPEIVTMIGIGIESAGVLVIVTGFLFATVSAAKGYFSDDRADLYVRYRRQMGRSMMLGLEFLVAGDIVRTVVVAHSVQDVLALGLLVIIRTILVFTIHLEVEGRWPWQGPTQSA